MNSHTRARACTHTHIHTHTYSQKIPGQLCYIYIYRFKKEVAVVAKSESTIGRSDREGNSIIIRFRGNSAHISMAKALFPLLCVVIGFFFSISLCVLHYCICCRSSTSVILIDILRNSFLSLFFPRYLLFTVVLYSAVLCCFLPFLG